jgi:hypothetical protein
VHDLADPGGLRGVEQATGAVDVDGPQQVLIVREGYLRDVVVHDVDPVDRVPDDLAVADVGDHELDVVGSVGRVVQIEHPHRVAAIAQTLHEERAEVAAPARDERLHSSSPCSTHQRMLRRMPSYSSTSGWYPSSVTVAEMSQAMFLFISPSTCTCC